VDDFFTPELVNYLLSIKALNSILLSDDICFCNDKQCPKHETCRRWIGNYKGTNQYLSMTETLREGTTCDAWLAVNFQE
jgi:hypothetical protein